MPDVVVAGEGSVSAAWRERGVWEDVLIEELKGRLVAQRLEGSFTPVTGLCPELLCGKVDIGKGDNWEIHNR